MKLKPMNKTVIIECEKNSYQCDDSAKVMKILTDVDRKIILPEHNTLEKVSSYGRIVRAANDCEFPFKIGQRICFDRFKDTPLWHYEDGKRYRIIKEHYIHYVEEE